jgi:ADP-ribose pyrophosphatase YjhB (NUDIX family)
MAILLDTGTNNFIRQGFIALRIVISRENNGQTEYLMQKRTKVPFRGYLAEPGGKILFGDDVLQAAERNLSNETGLHADLEIKGLVHFKDIYEEKLMQDKYFFVVKGTNPTGELKPFGSTGQNVWLSADELSQNPRTHQGVDTITKISENSSFSFHEETHHTDEY